MKAYTDVNQSKKLAEILPIESADMSWAGNGFGKPYARMLLFNGYPDEICPCWSLTALLEQMPCVVLESSRDNHYRVFWKDKFSDWHTNPVDACLELITRKEKEQ